MVSLFTASTSFAIDTSNENTKPVIDKVEMFKQLFDIAVMKESVINIEPPKQEMIEINANKLEALMESGENLKIGSMEVKTTANRCYAKISTKNDFKLQGLGILSDTAGMENEVRPTLATYGLLYTVHGLSTLDNMTDNMYAKFSSNKDEPIMVGCDTANLEMNVLNYNVKAPSDIYTDVITVEVRAES
jgi:hypothetical protein